jgi:electron transfer flavoprotein alpha subunit
MKRVGIFLEAGTPEELDSLLCAAAKLCCGEPDHISAAVIGSGEDEAAPRAASGKVDTLLLLDPSRYRIWDTAAIAEALERIARMHRLEAVLFPSCTFSRMTAPITAARLGAGLVAEVTDIREESGTIELVRPALSGRMLAGIVCRPDRPLLMSIRTDAFSCPPQEAALRRTELSRPEPGDGSSSGIRLLKRESLPPVEDIRESEVLVSGGAGIMRRFDELEELARLLGGMTAASRRTVDGGRAPRQLQVGQSGKSVSPRLYIAVGISGAIQHIVGITNARYIIAVNKDPHAPIFALADIAVVGDGMQFVSRLIERIREEKKTRAQVPASHGGTV